MKMQRLAIWTYGGIGAGLFSQGYPMMSKVLQGLSSTYYITLFSFVSVATSYRLPGCEIVSPPLWLKPGMLRWFYLILHFIWLHIKNGFKGLFAFWGYPSGFIVTCLGKILGIPSMVNVLGAELTYLPEVNFGLLGNPLRRKMICWTLQKCNALITISAFQAHLVKELGINRKSHIIPWGADPGMFPFEIKNWETLQVLHVANLNPVKDQTTLLKTFALLRRHQEGVLRIVGADFLEGKIQMLAKTLGIEEDVQFVGAVAYEQMQAHYQWANMMLHTSLYEGQSMAVTEALASGLLVGGTSVGILNDLPAACCIVTTPGEPEKLAELLMQRMPEAAFIARNAKSWSEQHNFDYTIREMKEVIQQTMNA